MDLIRRPLGSLLVTLGLFFTGLAVFAHLSEISLLQPGRLQQASGQLLADPIVRSAISDSVTNSVNSLLPLGDAVPAPVLGMAINSALANSQVRKEFAADMNTAQLRLLGKTDKSVVLGGPAFTAAISSAVATVYPSAATQIAQQGLSISIPGADLPNLGRYLNKVSELQQLFFTLALALVSLGFIIHPQRSMLLRRVGLWLVGISIINAFLFWFVPSYILPTIATSWSEITAVVLKATVGPAAAFYLTLFGAGIATLVASKIVKRTAYR